MTGPETSPTAASGQRYAEVDVTDWPLVGDEIRGTKPKRWLRDPETGSHWLMKDTTESVYGDGTRYWKGDDWSERVASAVAVRLGLPAARAELAFRDQAEGPALGVISLSVLAASGNAVPDREELVDGNQLLRHPVVGRDRSRYTLTAIADALRGVDAPDGLTGDLSDLGAWDVFVGYLILDAVVGNTDRHEENWAVILRDGDRSLAPTFDHASCLGFMLTDEQRSLRLRTRDQGFTPEAYASRARTPFAAKPHPVVVAKQAMAMSGTRAGDLWLDRCSDADRLAEPLSLVPEHRMSGLARQFAERVLRRNCRQLLTGSD